MQYKYREQKKDSQRITGFAKRRRLLQQQIQQRLQRRRTQRRPTTFTSTTQQSMRHVHKEAHHQRSQRGGDPTHRLGRGKFHPKQQIHEDRKGAVAGDDEPQDDTLHFSFQRHGDVQFKFHSPDHDQPTVVVPGSVPAKGKRERGSRG